MEKIMITLSINEDRLLRDLNEIEARLSIARRVREKFSDATAVDLKELIIACIEKQPLGISDLISVLEAVGCKLDSYSINLFSLGMVSMGEVRLDESLFSIASTQ